MMETQEWREKNRNDETTKWYRRMKKKNCIKIYTERKTQTHTHTDIRMRAGTHMRVLSPHTSSRRCVASSGGECIASARHSHMNNQWRHRNVGAKERDGRTQRNNWHMKRNGSAGEATRAYAIKKGKENDEEPSTTCTDVFRCSSLVVRLCTQYIHMNTQRIREFIDMPPSVHTRNTNTLSGLNETQAFDITTAGGRPRPRLRQQQ